MSSHAAPVAQTAPPPPAPQLAAEALSTAVLVPYIGQIPEPAHALAYLPHATVALQDGGMLMQLADMQLPITWRNAHPAPSVALHTRLAGVLHVVDGATAQQRRDLSRYGGATYHSLYHYIDLDLALVGDRLKSTWHVAPSGDPTQISWAYPVSLTLALAPGGELVVAQPDGTAVLSETAPLAWQDTAGGRVDVPVTYAISGTTVQFQLGSYDPTLPLVIDPEFVPSAFLEQTYAYALDHSTSGVTILDRGSGRVTAYSAGGSLLWENIIIDGREVTGITIDETTDTVYLVMRRRTAGTQLDSIDLYQGSVDSGGLTLVATLVNESSIYIDSGDVVIDAAGQAYVSWWEYDGLGDYTPNNYTCYVWSQATQSSTYIQHGTCPSLARAGTGDLYTVVTPNTNGSIYRLIPNGSSLSLSYCGNVNGPGVVAADGAVVIVANHDHAAERIRVQSWTADCTRRYDIVIDAGQYTHLNGIAVDATGRATLVGTTTSPSFPQEPAQGWPSGAIIVGFVVRILPDGSAHEYSSYYRYSGRDETFLNAVAVDATGTAYVAGNATGASGDSFEHDSFLLTIRAPIPTPEAAPLPAYPGYSTSWYQRQSMSEVHKRQGCLALQEQQGGVIALFYGSPRGGPTEPDDFGSSAIFGSGWEGSRPDNSIWFSTADIIELTMSFLAGYINLDNTCSTVGVETVAYLTPRPLHLAIATSNSYRILNQENTSISAIHAAAWAAMIDDINSLMQTDPWTQFPIEVVGGFDAEPLWEIEQGPAATGNTQEWIQAFDAYQQTKSVNTRDLLMIFGSIDGGPRHGPPNEPWDEAVDMPKLEMMYEWTYKNSSVRLIPQVYNILYIQEWYQLQRYVQIHRGLTRYGMFPGVLTQCQDSGCNVNFPLSWTEVWTEANDLCGVNYGAETRSPDWSPEQGWRATYDTFRRSLNTEYTLSAGLFLADTLVLLPEQFVVNVPGKQDYITDHTPLNGIPACTRILAEDVNYWLPVGTTLSAHVVIPSSLQADTLPLNESMLQPLTWSTDVRPSSGIEN